MNLFNYHLETKHSITGERKFACDKCEKRFIFETSVGLHKTKEHKVKKQCPYCDYKVW